MKGRAGFNFKLGLFLISVLFLMMLVSFFYTPFDINEMNVEHKFHKPSTTYLFGTDNFGRDIFSRVMQASQTAFYVGGLSVAMALLAGIIIGSVSGYFGGWVDEVIMRLIDALMAFPSILLAIVFIAVFGTSTINTIIAISIRAIPQFARIVRSGYLQFREMEFVKAAKSLGANSLRIMYKHILPCIVSPLIIASSIQFATAVLSEAGLSYLGLGVQPPDPSWGKMIYEAQSHMQRAPWFTLAPGVMITTMVLGFNLLGDGIRDLLDSRM